MSSSKKDKSQESSDERYQWCLKQRQCQMKNMVYSNETEQNYNVTGYSF